MSAKDTPSADDPAQSGTVQIGGNSRVALGLLRQAYVYAEDAGTALWDFALEIGRLFDTGLRISDLRWLVAKGFVEHGQETSVYGSPHRSFCHGDGFFFDNTTCVVLTPSGAAFIDHFLNEPVASLQSIQPFAVAILAGGGTAAL